MPRSKESNIRIAKHLHATGGKGDNAALKRAIALEEAGRLNAQGGLVKAAYSGERDTGFESLTELARDDSGDKKS